MESDFTLTFGKKDKIFWSDSVEQVNRLSCLRFGICTVTCRKSKICLGGKSIRF